MNRSSSSYGSLVIAIILIHVRMNKYLQKHRESGVRRGGLPALAGFHRSLEYGDRNGLKQFLKDDSIFVAEDLE